jgi:hypothetical protein
VRRQLRALPRFAAMVVHYASGGEGSWTSIFATLPRMIIKREGSVIPHITPQLLIVIGLGVLAHNWDPLGKDSDDNPDAKSIDITPAMQTVGILLSFLMVFKTQNAFGQFWEASRDIQRLLAATRHLCRLIVTSFEWTQSDDHTPAEAEAAGELRGKVRKALRLLVLHFFVVVEYFQRTGDEETAMMKFDTMMTLRQNIKKLSGVHVTNTTRSTVSFESICSILIRSNSNPSSRPCSVLDGQEANLSSLRTRTRTGSSRRCTASMTPWLKCVLD